MELTVRCPNCKSNVPIGYPICPYCGFDLRPIIRLKARRELTKWDILKRVKKALFTPWKLHRDIMIAPDSLGPLILILILSMFSAFRTTMLIGKFISLVKLYEIFRVDLLIILSTVAGLFLYTVIWIAVSIYVNFVVKLLGSRPDISLTRSITGYSAGILFAPFLVSSIVTLMIPNVIDITVISYFSNLSRTIIFASAILYLLSLSDAVSKAYAINRVLFFILSIPLFLAAFLVF